jgi:hypothetical protein
MKKTIKRGASIVLLAFAITSLMGCVSISHEETDDTSPYGHSHSSWSLAL